MQRAYEKDLKKLWDQAKVIRKTHDRGELFISEKMEILKAGLTDNVINIRQADNVTKAWRYAIKNYN